MSDSLIQTGTHLMVDALMCPYRIGERVRVKKLLRSVTSGTYPTNNILLIQMWIVARSINASK